MCVVDAWIHAFAFAHAHAHARAHAVRRGSLWLQGAGRSQQRPRPRSRLPALWPHAGHAHRQKHAAALPGSHCSSTAVIGACRACVDTLS